MPEKIKENIDKIYSHIKYNLYRNVIHLESNGKSKGNVLLSYIIHPFLLDLKSSEFNNHTNMWECLKIAEIWKNNGYSVDIINWDDKIFLPKKEYDVFIDIHSNIDRLSRVMSRNCIKIIHVTGAHWLFQNRAEYGRLLALQQRRGITLKPRRLAQPSQGIENADFATILGNQFTIDTFSYAKKPVYRIPISTTVLYDWPEDKDFETCSNHFLWFGGSGMVHKGLDLVLEAFVEMPEYNLTVCGPVENEEDFEIAYYKELYQTPNIQTTGWIDVSSSKFLNILKNNIGLVYPSCSEGGGGSVINCIHAGLIPIVSYESSVDTDDFGIILNECSIEEIKNSVHRISSLLKEELKLKSRKAWEFARNCHTKEKFADEYLNVIKKIMNFKGREL